MSMLRVVTQNIWGKNNQWQARANAIGRNMRDLEVDIICIQESAPDHFEYLRSHSFRRFPHAYYAPSDNGSITPWPQGLAVFSRLATLETGKVDIGREVETRNSVDAHCAVYDCGITIRSFLGCFQYASVLEQRPETNRYQVLPGSDAARTICRLHTYIDRRFQYQSRYATRILDAAC